MKRHIILLQLLALVQIGFAQNWEGNICDCLEANYNNEDADFFRELESLASLLKSKGKKIDGNEELRLLLLTLSEPALMDMYNVDWSERMYSLGWETIRYCMRREQFNQHYTERHWSKNLFKSIERLSLTSSRSTEFYVKERAKIINRIFSKDISDPKLQRAILLNELYRLIPNHSEYQLLQYKNPMLLDSKPKNNGPDQKNVEVRLNERKEIFLGGECLDLEELCHKIKGKLMDGYSINFYNSRKTIYTFYKEVYSELKSCVNEVREIVSMQNFGAAYNQLDSRQRVKVDQLYTTRIKEHKPE